MKAFFVRTYDWIKVLNQILLLGCGIALLSLFLGELIPKLLRTEPRPAQVEIVAPEVAKTRPPAETRQIFEYLGRLDETLVFAVKRAYIVPPSHGGNKVAMELVSSRGSYRESVQNATVNIVFRDPTGVERRLLEHDAFVKRAHLNFPTNNDEHRFVVPIFEVVESDTNGNGALDAEDVSSLWVCERSGAKPRRIASPFEEYSTLNTQTLLITLDGTRGRFLQYPVPAGTSEEIIVGAAPKSP